MLFACTLHMHCMHTVQLLSAHGGVQDNLYLHNVHTESTGQPLTYGVTFICTWGVQDNLYLHNVYMESTVQPLTYGVTFICTWGVQANLYLHNVHMKSTCNL